MLVYINIMQLCIQVVVLVIWVEEVLKIIVEKKDDCSWMIQCGFFKGVEQVEIVCVQLVFEGFVLYIIINNGWNCVVIGLLKGKESVNEMIICLKMVGYVNCICFVVRG